MFHKESVAVMEYNTVKETIWAKLVLLSGKLCYQTKTGILVGALVRVSFPRGEESAVRGPFLICLLPLLLPNLLNSIKAGSSDDFPPGPSVHLQHAVLLLHIVLNAVICRSRCLSSILNLPQL